VRSLLAALPEYGYLWSVNLPDFSWVWWVALDIFLLGLSIFAMSYWVYRDGIDNQRFTVAIKKIAHKVRETSDKVEEHEEKPEERSTESTTSEKPEHDTELLKCPGCGKRLASDFEFCPHCGYRQKPKCSKCGKEVSKGFTFCPYCGSNL
jgi:RNA polymerase subunit RPABC4/transcription elongation factor Spt4